jgi:endonuclease/exonuclease/phosphatase family metal-dependent hydrolase
VPLVRVATYNILQGHNEAGQPSIEEQVALLAELDADIIGLQESDTNRIAGGNDDLVRYAADRLEMYSYYGPSPVVGTFGIALLSRFPLEHPRTFYMYSEGEQTATIHATVHVGGMPFNILVTHLGNGGPLVQQEAILAEAAGMERVILMGDFNFRPDSPQYAQTVDVFDDAWVKAGSTPAAEIDPDDSVDHVFISPVLTADEAYYVNSWASDHPALFAVVTTPAEE